MAISGVSLASPTNVQNPADPRQQLLALAKAINSGNLTGAQQAFAQLSQTLGGNSTGSGSSGSNTNTKTNTNTNKPNDPFSQALDAIGQALQSGDISGAQQALASLQQQAQSGRAHHHHGGHRGGGGSNGGTNASTATSPLTSGTTGTSATVGTSVDVTA
jgi:hypothetical protein